MTVKLTEAEFIAAWDRYGSARHIAVALGMSESSIQGRRKRLRARGIDLRVRAAGTRKQHPDGLYDDRWTFAREKLIDVDTGCIVVSSDHHYQPGEASIAHRALIEVIREVRPRVKILNGDIFDGSSISRHDPFGWSERVTVKDEIDACQTRVSEIENVLPKGCQKFFNVGNHDIRFERSLVSKAPEYAGIHGLRLEDHFPSWELQWSTLINPDHHNPVMIKHRFASSGVHAGYNATLKAGITTVSGHTHLLDVKAWGDYRGRRYGIQTGCVADLKSASMEYAENNPSPACPGFAVLTFCNGRLLYPELCEVMDGKAYFRGKVIV